jgi:pimeloyl-ACP methyl ester carboxylesterase
VDYLLGHVISHDGTRIGYRQIGHGPGVILVQGAMGTAQNFDELARGMAGDFTVYVPDRRGRGMTPKEYGPDHSVKTEVQDLESLQIRTGASRMFGLSSGGIIALEFARAVSGISKVAVYEPPFQLEGIPAADIARFHRQVAEGKLAAALVTALTIVKLAPRQVGLIPRPLRVLLAQRALAADRDMAGRGYARLRDLVPAMRFDFNIVSQRGDQIASYDAVSAEVLLLGGTRSAPYLLKVLDVLEKILQNVRRIDLDGKDHSAPWNQDRGGSPQSVAQALQAFFLDKGVGGVGHLRGR